MKTTNCINCGAEVTSPNSDLCNSCGEVAVEEWFDYIGTIETAIKEKYKTKEAFCEENNYRYKDFASKLRTLLKKLSWLNKFLRPLGLEIQIVPKGNSAEA